MTEPTEQRIAGFIAFFLWREVNGTIISTIFKVQYKIYGHDRSLWTHYSMNIDFAHVHNINVITIIILINLLTQLKLMNGIFQFRKFLQWTFVI